MHTGPQTNAQGHSEDLTTKKVLSKAHEKVKQLRDSMVLKLYLLVI